MIGNNSKCPGTYLEPGVARGAHEGPTWCWQEKCWMLDMLQKTTDSVVLLVFSFVYGVAVFLLKRRRQARRL